MTLRQPEPDPTEVVGTSARLSQSQGQTVLWATLALAPLSSSSVHAEREWVKMFPQSSTINAAIPDVAKEKPARAPQALPKTAHQLTALQAFFGLSKTQLAQLCGVQRQTVYDWLAGNFEAEGGNARRLAKLFGITEFSKKAGARPLSGRDLLRPLSDGTTLLAQLASEDATAEGIACLAMQFEQGSAAKDQTAAAIRTRLGWQRESAEATARNLDANLDDFTDG
jgi:DNA-binding XRE family transcriptional regulator